jgi:hypothetical protein
MYRRSAGVVSSAKARAVSVKMKRRGVKIGFAPRRRRIETRRKSE